MMESRFVKQARRYCCHIDSATGARCENVPEWELWDDGDPDDPYSYVDTCTAHIAALLTDAREHRLYPLPVP